MNPIDRRQMDPFRGSIPEGTPRLQFRITKVANDGELLERIGLVTPEAESLREIVDASERKLNGVGLTRRIVNTTIGHEHLEEEVISKYFKLIQWVSKQK